MYDTTPPILLTSTRFQVRGISPPSLLEDTEVHFTEFLRFLTQAVGFGGVVGDRARECQAVHRATGSLYRFSGGAS